MKVRSAVPVALTLALLASGCNKDYPNPFAAGGTSKVPPTGAALTFTSSAWSSTAGAGREVYSIAADGTNPTRLTFCNTDTQACDSQTASLAPEGKRAAMTRVVAGVPGTSLVYADLTRAVEATITPATAQVDGIDWSASGDVLAYSGVGVGAVDDLFRSDVNGANAANLTSTTGVSERNPRIDLGTSIVVYERTETGGKSEVFIYVSGTQQARVTPVGPGGALLAGTPYLVGSDANPTFSPDAGSLVFRRLTGLGAGGLGTWDILTAKNDGTGVVTLATGPLYRGEPDWSAAGIVYPEVDVAAGTASLVVIQPDGSGRKVIYTQGASFALSSPRWLRQVMP